MMAWYGSVLKVLVLTGHLYERAQSDTGEYSTVEPF
jgi:hypothetical protein